MTMQIADSFDYINKEYTIIARQNKSLFEPCEQGFSPIPFCTACWRGFYCTYSIDNDHLTVSQLGIGLETDSPPIWRGTKPSKAGDLHCWIYEGVNFPIDYSGGIIIGRGFVKEFYDILGFYKPHCFEDVLELIFEKGKLVNKVVHDEYMGKAREIIRSSSQVYKRSIGYFEDAQTVTIKVPKGVDIKSFTLLVKELASEHILSTTIELFNNFRSKGHIDLDKKMYFWEYRNLASSIETKGYKNVVLTEYSTDCDTHLETETVIAQHPNSGQLLELYNKYGLGKIYLL